jgi:hypothetical protein
LCFSALSKERGLSSPEDFADLEKFALIQCTIGIEAEGELSTKGGGDIDLFEFVMGQSFCKVIRLEREFENFVLWEKISDEDKNCLREVNSYEIKDASWKVVLVDFIKRIRKAACWE